MDQMFIIVNPVSANSNTAKEWPCFEKVLMDSSYEFEYVMTEYPGHATELASKALKSGYGTIMSVGGDGTMNEVINGFFEDGRAINADSKLAVFSSGTGCDFIRTLGINKGLEGLLSVLDRNQTKQLDLGLASFIDESENTIKRYFMNIADIGIGAETANRVNKHSKKLKGFLSFMLGTLSTIILYKNKYFEIEIDDKIFLNGIINSVIVANGKYFGGGMKVAPDAVTDDGFFDIIIIGDIGKPELIKSFPLIYKGEHMNHAKIRHYRGRKVEVRSGGKGLIELDGEIPGRYDTVFEIIPKAIRVLI